MNHRQLKALTHIRYYDYKDYCEAGFVIFSDKIVAMGEMASFEKAVIGLGSDVVLEVEDGGGRLLLPGLINFHTHVYSALIRGFDFKRSPQTFTDLLKGVWWRLDHFLTLENLDLSARVYGADCLKSGVVAVIDHHASGVIGGSTAQVEQGLAKVGVHGITCFETSDRFNLEAALTENCEMIQRTGGPFGLHASMSLSDNSLAEIAKRLGQHPIHVHVSESLEDHMTLDKTPMERLQAYGLVNKDSLLAHCVHISEGDAKLIAASKAVVAINARSNLNNVVGTFNYRLLSSYGIPMVVGTDGLGADVARSWQDFYYLGKSSTGDMDGMALSGVHEALLASYDYYERLTGRRLGRFKEGYTFDGLLVDYKPFTPCNASNIFGHVFFGVFDAMRPVKVWTDGVLRVDGGELVSEVCKDHKDYEDYKDLAQVEALWKRIEVQDGYDG